jgi:Glycosyltransferase 61
VSGSNLFSRYGRDHVSEIPKLYGSGTRIFVGFPDTEISSRFRQFGERVSDTPPEVRSFENVRLEPLLPQGQWQFTGGAYCNGEFLTELALRSGWRAGESRHVTGGATTRKPERKLKTAWFGGILLGHFGHFLLETLARVQSREVVQSAEPIVFFDPWGFARLRPFMEGAFRHLGIAIDRIRLCSVPLEVRTLLVQKPTLQLNGFVNVSTRAVLKHAAPIPAPQSGIVYLARSEAKVLRRVLNEEELERRLDSSAQTRIIFPEKLSFAEQLACLRNSDVVSGCEGSAFHSLTFVEGSRTSLMFCGSLPSLNYFLCDELIDGDAIYARCGANDGDRGGPVTRRTDWVLDVDKAIDLIDRTSNDTVHGPGSAENRMAQIKPPDAPADRVIWQSHSVRRINQIARHVGARSYLEIGVFRGKTFNALDFERKVAVDPKFQFDVADYQREGVEFHHLHSDQYFIRHGLSQTFDIIFLDGLHTFQQTLRDFCNSLACAHDRTVWLIDDVLPVDVFSAWPNQTEAVAFRKRAGGDGWAWHGDVYKVVFAIHDYFPMYSYVTLGGRGNPQAIVWKAPRVDFTPIFDSMEAIERVSYFDLLKREEILKVRPDEEGLRLFLESMAAVAERGAPVAAPV